jgi:hypothetical protein
MIRVENRTNERGLQHKFPTSCFDPHRGVFDKPDLLFIKFCVLGKFQETGRIESFSKRLCSSITAVVEVRKNCQGSPVVFSYAHGIRKPSLLLEDQHYWA